MSFNSRYKPGPTLDEAEGRGATHLLIECGSVDCGCKCKVEVRRILINRKPAPRNVPVNRLQWLCPNCRSNYFSVMLVVPAAPRVIENGLQLAGLRPRRRRGPWFIYGVRGRAS